MAFGRDDQGRIAYLFSGQGYHGAYTKLAWYETPAPHLTVLYVSALLFLATLIAWPVSAWIHSRRGKSAGVSSILSRLARWLATAIWTPHTLFIIGIALVTANPFELVYGIPPRLHVTLALALLAVVMTVGLPVFTVLAWKDGYWSFLGRVHYTLLTIVVPVFTWLFDCWNLLVILLHAFFNWLSVFPVANSSPSAPRMPASPHNRFASNSKYQYNT